MPLAPSVTRIVLALALAACAPAYRVEVTEPRFDGVRTATLRGNVLGGSLLGPGDLALGLERVDRPRAAPEFALVLERTGDGPPIGGGPLLLVLDGDSLSLPRDSAAGGMERYDGVPVERARYPAAPADLRRLAGAAAATLRVRVGPWEEERRLHPRNLEHLRRFVAERVPADSAAAAAPPVAP